MTDQFLAPFIARSRWFGGKGRDFTVTGEEVVGSLGEAPRVEVLLAEITYADGDTELYQVPLALYDEQQDHLEHALVGAREGRHAYDAVQDREAMAAYLRAFADAPVVEEVAQQPPVVEEVAQQPPVVEEVAQRPSRDPGLRFVRLPGHELDPDATASLFSGEQSNSSVFFGEDAVLKLFRKVTPGENPDVTTHRALTEAGSTHVAALYGWIDQDDRQLGMLQQFLRTASDGWGQALASVRDLFAEADLHAEEVGGDFAGEAARLGEALAEVHHQLRVAFPTSTMPASALAELMAQRLDAAIGVVPQLAEHADGARAVFAAVASLGEVAVQRVHGDLHLGQTLRTVAGWKFVDFEGEPAKPLAERLLPDSPWRDVAGMTRSFDYAPHAVAASMPAEDADVEHQRAIRAGEWAKRNRRAFLATYCGDGGLGPADRTLLTAYVVDKAVYECLYEARNRPNWLSIPLEGVARLVGTRSTTSL